MSDEKNTEKNTEKPKPNPIVEGNLRIFRYMNRNADQKFVEWSIDVYLHNPQHTALMYHTGISQWRKMMDVIEEIEKEEIVASVKVGTQYTVIRFKNGNSADISVKTNAEVDKKQACWRTIVNFMVYLEKKKAREKLKEKEAKK